MAKAADYVPYTGPLVTREEARAAGLKRFFNGNPCVHGHVAERTLPKGMCIVCKNLASQVAYYANREKELARRALWKKNNRPRINKKQTEARKKNKDRDREWRRAWDKKTPERQIAASAAYYARNAEMRRAKSLEWYYANPTKASAQRANRRALVKSAEGTHTAEDIQRIGTLQKWRCHWCGKSIKRGYHVDHIQPLSKGGTNWPSNLAIACGHCNLSKHNSDPIAFAMRRGRLL
jgi:5-methylcytosine-specific restriction endonuclease McrA